MLIGVEVEYLKRRDRDSGTSKRTQSVSIMVRTSHSSVAKDVDLEAPSAPHKMSRCLF